MKTGYDNLSTVDRASRMALGFALIGVAYLSSGALGALALLPIVAIIPMMTATWGYCPLESALAKSFATRNARSVAPVASRHIHGH